MLARIIRAARPREDAPTYAVLRTQRRAGGDTEDPHPRHDGGAWRKEMDSLARTVPPFSGVGAPREARALKGDP